MLETIWIFGNLADEFRRQIEQLQIRVPEIRKVTGSNCFLSSAVLSEEFLTAQSTSNCGIQPPDKECCYRSRRSPPSLVAILSRFTTSFKFASVRIYFSFQKPSACWHQHHKFFIKSEKGGRGGTRVLRKCPAPPPFPPFADFWLFLYSMQIWEPKFAYRCLFVLLHCKSKSI